MAALVNNTKNIEIDVVRFVTFIFENPSYVTSYTKGTQRTVPHTTKSIELYSYLYTNTQFSDCFGDPIRYVHFDNPGRVTSEIN